MPPMIRTFPIMVWEFDRAPKKYQDLSEHGGDEDWIAFFPTMGGYSISDDISWCSEGSPFGVCEVSKHEVPGGHIRIGAHA